MDGERTHALAGWPALTKEQISHLMAEAMLLGANYASRLNCFRYRHGLGRSYEFRDAVTLEVIATRMDDPELERRRKVYDEHHGYRRVELPR